MQTGDNIIACVTKSGSDKSAEVQFHDNTRTHTADTVRVLLQKFKWEVLSHPSYSPGLSPCDYAIFRPLKRLRGANDSPRTTASSSTCRTGAQRSPGNFTRLPFTALCRNGTSASTARVNTSDMKVREGRTQ